jgi:tetratricopeptide (TPR) repeat protein
MMRRNKFGCVLSGTPIACIAFLLLLPTPAALGDTAKLVLEDGRPFTTVPLALPPLTGSSCLVQSIGLDGRIMYTSPLDDFKSRGTLEEIPREEYRSTDACQAVFLIKGYGKITATLHDGAVIVVKRGGDKAEGSAVSLTTLEAPPEARRAWEKGMKALENKKWTQAEKELRRAVTIHPEYASAWSALGEALDELSRPVEARDAWGRAIQADPDYVKPYVLLAQLAIREGRMEDAVSITDRAMKARYTRSLSVYFYNAVANLALGRLEPSEQSARKAVELDPAHLVSKTEDLLGTVLAAKGDRQGAVEHLKKYLELSPKAEDAQKVKQRIKELES